MSNPSETPIRFNCAQCQKPLSVPVESAGKSMACPECQAPLQVPGSAHASVGEAPAPVVKSGFEAIAAERGAAVPAPAGAEVPMLNAASEAPVVQTLSMSSDEAMDPTAAASKTPRMEGFSAQVAQDMPRPARRNVAEAKKPSRAPVMAIAVLVIAAAAGGIGITVRNGLERKRIQEDIEGRLGKAHAAYVNGEIDAAAKEAQAALDRIKASSQSLDAGLIKKWSERANYIEAMHDQVAQAEVIFKDAEKNAAETRIRLENKKALLGDSSDAKPVRAKYDQFLAEIEKVEKNKKLEKIRTGMQAADGLYRDGKIEDAASRAAAAVKAMEISPKIHDAELEKRADVLRKRAGQLEQARRVRTTASSDFSGARKKLQEQLDAIDGSIEDLRPLKSAIAAVRKDVLDDEKRSRKLTSEQEAVLTGFINALKARDGNIRATGVEGEFAGIKYNGKPLGIGFQQSALSRRIIIEASGNRLLVSPDALAGVRARPGRVFLHAAALGEAMQKAGVASEDAVWDATNEAPFPSARRTGEDGREYLFLQDRLYIGKPTEKGASDKEVEAEFKKAAEDLAKAIENDQPSPEEVRSIVAFAVRCSAKTPAEEDWYDHLPGEFVRRVINESYVEKNLPGSAQRLKAQLAAYHEAYRKISNPWKAFDGSSKNGGCVRELRTFEDHSIWQIYDKAGDTTTFAIKDPDDEKDCLFILYEMPGKLDTFPENATPRAVRMTHQSVGVISSYDPATGKMEYDREKWNLAAALEMPAMPQKYIEQEGFGTPGWALPPHVLLVDRMGRTKSIVTPYGKLDVQDFSKIADEKQRTAAMEEFLNKMAKVLPSGNYLHLYFRYFDEYVLDSPLTSNTTLLGSRAHCGDIHQTAYQSLERLMGGRYVGDCDDLAEFYMNITRRQGKLSYVMALPSHAACGWAEQNGKDGDYTFYVIDTGPPRMFTDRNLDKVIEQACRAYDEDKTMRFDPKSLGFLFRFNGEPTRTPYWLSSRMYVDRAYGEAMERVQSYWHFHFYALGIKTMTEMIEKGDRVPENCIELAGLYGQVHEIKDSIKWTNEALKQFGPEDLSSRFSELFRIGMMWREDHNNEKSYESMKGMIAELRRLERDPRWFNYTSMRLQVMGLLESIDRPFEAWELVQHDIYQFARHGRLRIEHVGGLTEVYRKMAELKRGGRELTDAETAAMKRLEEILNFFYSKAVFAQPDDDFNAYMRKYAFIGLYYDGKYGSGRLEKELLKDGPWPDPAKPRNHQDRSNPEAEDWKWIRLSLPAYSILIADAVDMDDPPEKWRKDDAVKLIDAMKRAADHARKFGSLASSEFELLSLRVFRDFLVKDWPDLEKVLQETKTRDWARLTSAVAETFGKSARFVDKDEFARQFKVFTKYIKSRPSFYTVVYEAYRADAFEQALAASDICLQCNPGDEDMIREAKYLKELAAKKIAQAQAAKKPAPKPSPVEAK